MVSQGIQGIPRQEGPPAVRGSVRDRPVSGVAGIRARGPPAREGGKGPKRARIPVHPPIRDSPENPPKRAFSGVEMTLESVRLF